MTLPQSGRLDGGEQPQGLPDARAQRLFAATVFLPAWDIKLLLVAEITAQVLCFTSHRGDRSPSRPAGCAVAMALAPPTRPRHGKRGCPLAGSATTSCPGLPAFTTLKSFMKTCVFTPAHETGILVAHIIPYAGSHDTRLGRESSWPLVPSGTHSFFRPLRVKGLFCARTGRAAFLFRRNSVECEKKLDNVHRREVT